MEGISFLPGIDSKKHFQLVWRLGDFDAAEQLEAEHEKPYKELFAALVAGKIDSFDYYGGGPVDSRNWYILTRSTRPGVLVQMSVIWCRGADLLPLSHRNINGFDDLAGEIPADGVSVHWLRLPAAAA